MSKRGLSARHSVPNQTLSLVNFRLPKGNPAAVNPGRPGGYGARGPGSMPGNAVTRPVGPRPSRQPLRLPRHCERSEAIQTSTRGIDGLLRRFAPRNDVDMTSRTRGALRPRLASSFVPLRNRGRREDRVLAAPAVSRAICANKRAHEHTGQREHSGLPCAMALRLTSCSSRRTALLPPSSARQIPPT